MLKQAKKSFLILLLILSLALIFNLCISCVSAAPGDVIYVNCSSGNDLWDGLSSTWNGTSGPKLTIKNASGAVNSGGTVNIADGNYKGINNTKIIINKNMVLNGQSQTGTVINGTDSSWIFMVQKGAVVTISNLTITNGYIFDGPGVICNEGYLTLNHCNFLKNSQQGSVEICVGPIYNKGTLTVTNSNFMDNYACNSGGGVICNAGTLTVTGSNFTNNSGYGCGGAILNWDTLTVTVSNFNGNQAYGAGGAIFNAGNLTVTGSSFTNNYACGYGAGPIVKIAGGAIFNEYGSNYILNSCQFAGNIPQDIYNGTKPFDDYYGGYGEGDSGYGESGNSFNDPVTTVKAASKTMPLQKTGMPLAGFVSAVLMVLSGMVLKRR